MSLFFTPPNKKTISERSLYPIVAANVLLSSNKRKKIIKDIRQTVDISDEYFNTLYQQLINNFVEFVQLLPTNNEASLGSLMDKGLLRALFALQLQKDETENHDPDPLLTYTLFSASLLFDAGFATNNRTVILSKKDGTFVKEWSPYKGKMQKSGGGYYRIRPGGDMTPELSRHSTILLTQQLIPAVGFNWITQDRNAFNAWIEVLNNEKAATNNLQPYFDSANKKALYETPQKAFPTTNIKPTKPKETALGEDFLEWIKKALKTKTIAINTYNSDIHVIEGGLFLEIPELIKKFCAQSSKNPKAEQIFAQLKKIGFISLSETREELATYTYTNIDDSNPLSFMWQLDLYKSAITDDQTIKSKQKLWEQSTKHKIRHGIEVFMPCFLSLFLAYYLDLLPEHNFISIKLEKAKNKLKRKLLKKIRHYKARMELLRREMAEATQLQFKTTSKK
jgi:hypothetical protein